MPNRNKKRFIFTTDLRLIKPYVGYNICIEDYISRFEANDVILYNKNIGFALIKYIDFYPIDILNDPFCLAYIYIHENYRDKGHGKRLMNLILKHFQIIIHSLEESVGFFEKFKLEKVKTNMLFGLTFISTNLNINRDAIVNNCIQGCGRSYSGYKRYVCDNCYIEFAIYNIDINLIETNKSLRFKLNVNQPAINFSNTDKSLFDILINIDIDYQRDISKEVAKKLTLYQLE